MVAMYYKFIAYIKIKYMALAQRMGERIWNTAIRLLDDIWCGILFKGTSWLKIHILNPRTITENSRNINNKTIVCIKWNHRNNPKKKKAKKEQRTDGENKELIRW